MASDNLPSPRPRSRKYAALALLLIAPAPSIGVMLAMFSHQSAYWGAAKLWIILLPLIWGRWIDGQRWSISRPSQGGFGVAAASGLVIAAVIFAGYFLVGRTMIDPKILRDAVEPVGLANPAVYFGAAAYWITVNSVVEEYVYRWFIFRQAERLMGPGAAVAASGLIFVAHHTIAMSAYFPALLNGLASLSIFIGGALWSWMYRRYRSVWVPYVSHAIVDLSIFVIGAMMLFGH